MEAKANPQLRLWRTLEGIRLAIAASEAEFGELLGLPARRYLLLRERKGDIPLLALARLTERLSLSPERVREGRVDFAAVAAKWRKQAGYLPERYSVGAFSRRRPATNALSFIHAFQGWRKVDELLRHFQVDPVVFEKPDERINILFLSDLCSELGAQGYGHGDFFRMGAFSAVTNRSGPLGDALRPQRTVHGLYEKLVLELMHLFDENHRYRILRLTTESLVCEVSQRKEVAESLGLARFGGPALCAIRAGVGASAPAYLGLPFSEIRETRCVHRGDPSCVFVVSFSRPAAAVAAGVASARA